MYIHLETLYTHYSVVTWAPWHLNSLATQLYVQHEANIKALKVTGPFLCEFTSNQWIPFTMGQKVFPCHDVFMSLSENSWRILSWSVSNLHEMTGYALFRWYIQIWPWHLTLPVTLPITLLLLSQDQPIFNIWSCLQPRSWITWDLCFIFYDMQQLITWSQVLKKEYYLFFKLWIRNS